MQVYLAGYLLAFHDITKEKITEKKLYDSIQKMEDLNKLIYELSMTAEESDVYLKTSSAICNIIGFKICSFFVFNSGLLENKFSSTPEINNIFAYKFFYEEFILKKYNANKTIIIDIQENFELKKLINQTFPDISYILCIPIENIGMFLLFTADIDILNDKNIKICELITGNSIEALKRIWLQKSLKEQAEIDPLTGVYNRRYFDNYIRREAQRSKKYNYPITFIMTDVDRFKEVNDRYGHQIGDIVLKGVGTILKGQTRKIDTVVRYGGDEFLIILPGDSNENIDGFINRIKTAVLQWNEQVKLINFNIGLSMGVASWNPEHDIPVEKAINSADMAMYAQKRSREGKGENILN